MLKANYKYFKSVVILLIVLLFPILGYGQSPGGVSDPAMWLSVEEKDETFFLREKGSTVALNAVEKIELLNCNPTILFDENTLIPSIDYPRPNIDQLHIFSVFAPRDSILEKSVWHVQSDEKDELLLTTHRLADFGNGRFMNNLKHQKHQPQLNTYQRFINSKKESNYQIVFGDNQLKHDVPVTPFAGKFAEFIVYDRVLNNLDKAKVETYLALKYGLTIDKAFNQSLFDAAGKILWNTKMHTIYSNNIAGVGRDDASSFFQKQSGSAYSDNVFSLALNDFAEDNASNNSTLSDFQYLIWGSNLESLSQENKRPGLIQKLNRRWRIQNHGNISQPTHLIFDVSKIVAVKKPEEIFWLIIDQSGSNQFDIHSTNYFPMTEIGESGMVSFSGVSWANITSGHFSIGIGPELIPVMQVVAPDCSGEGNGSLLLTAQGGQAPYLFELFNDAGQKINVTTRSDDTPFEIDNISAGAYRLKITDKDNRRYQESFFINPKEAPISDLADEYFWNNQEEFILDGSIEGLTGIKYEWTTPSGNSFYNTAISIQEVGIYQLKLTKDDCIAQKHILISSAAPNNFKAINLFPNPVSNGIFQLDVQLEQLAELEIQLVSIAGTLLNSIHLDSQINHQYQGYIPEPGMYLVKLISAGSIETRKLIVHQKS